MSFQNEIWLAIVSGATDGGGTGSPSNPYVVNTPGSFATIFQSLPADRLIRLMPGVFRTWGAGSLLGNGYAGTIPSQIFTPKSGQKIIGAGMFATTIQFVWDTADFSLPAANLAYAPGQRHPMIASDQYLSSFELSDLCLDCNLGNVPKPFVPTVDSGRCRSSLTTQSSKSARGKTE